MEKMTKMVAYSGDVKKHFIFLDPEHQDQQHIYGGGSLLDIVDSFNEVVAESDFFQKMLGIKPAEEEKKTAKAKKTKDEALEE